MPRIAQPGAPGAKQSAGELGPLYAVKVTRRVAPVPANLLCATGTFDLYAVSRNTRLHQVPCGHRVDVAVPRRYTGTARRHAALCS